MFGPAWKFFGSQTHRESLSNCKETDEKNGLRYEQKYYFGCDIQAWFHDSEIIEILVCKNSLTLCPNE